MTETPRYTVYGMGVTRSIRALWALEEIGEPCTWRPLDFSAGESRQPWYLALHPLGKVPTLLDGEQVILESGAILNHLGYQHPEANLLPAEGSRERTRHDQLMFFGLTELEQPLWTRVKHTFALPEALRVPQMVSEVGPAEWRRAVAAFDTLLGEGPWALGERFTMVDILLGHTCNWARSAELDLGSERVQAYAERARARPAFQRAVARVKGA